MTSSATHPGIGSSAPRKEDYRLLTGNGSYSDDLILPGQAYAVMLRSLHPHARLKGINIAAAATQSGVLAILTAEEMRTSGLRVLPQSPLPRGGADIALPNLDGTPAFVSPQMPLPPDKVRHVGEVVAMLVAETVTIGRDAAELVEIEYESLRSVTRGTDAVHADAPLVWEDRPSNICLEAEIGDRAATEAAFAAAAHTVHLDTWIQRVTAAPMEPRAGVGAYDAASDRYILYAGSGGANRLQRQLAHALGVSQDRVRVITQDVGGNFGSKNLAYPEFALILWAAKRLGRPVKWTAERQESFQGDYQGRDLHVDAELALDSAGNFLAIRSSSVFNAGAQTVTFVPALKSTELVSTAYRIPSAHVRSRSVCSNLPPTTNYRSSGRPEATLVMERLIDLAARRHGFDRVELRRRNLIPSSAMPFTNPMGVTYDSGAYERAMDSALKLGEWSGFPERRAEALARGRLRGIGVANYVEMTTGDPRERAEITVLPEGRVEVVIGTQSSGQGHETSFAQLIVEWLGVAMDQVQLITGDTDVVVVGGGTAAGRSMRLAGIVMGNASSAILAKARRIAASVLGADEAAVTFREGRFAVTGGERSIDLFEVAKAALTWNDLDDGLRGPLSASSEETVKVAGFPFGSHVCEVEIDPETGVLEIVRYGAVDDVGRAVNPLIVRGQTHGGIAQGVGQALWEQCVYNGEGQLLTGSFMDYTMPRADNLPSFATEISELPSLTNALGIRSASEGGTTPALAAVMCAILDALAEFGVVQMEMPATPDRIWRAIRDSRPQGGA